MLNRLELNGRHQLHFTWCKVCNSVVSATLGRKRCYPRCGELKGKWPRGLPSGMKCTGRMSLRP